MFLGLPVADVVGSLTLLLLTLRPARSNFLLQFLAVPHLKLAHKPILVAYLSSAACKDVREAEERAAYRVPDAQGA